MFIFSAIKMLINSNSCKFVCKKWFTVLQISEIRCFHSFNFKVFINTILKLITYLKNILLESSLRHIDDQIFYGFILLKSCWMSYIMCTWYLPLKLSCHFWREIWREYFMHYYNIKNYFIFQSIIDVYFY